MEAERDDDRVHRDRVSGDHRRYGVPVLDVALVRYVTKIEIRADFNNEDMNPDAVVMTRAEREASISADWHTLIASEMEDETFTWFDVKVITVESDDA